MSFVAVWLDIEITILSKVSLIKDKYYDITYVVSKKMIRMNLLTKRKLTQRHRKQTSDYKTGKGEREVWD